MTDFDVVLSPDLTRCASVPVQLVLLGDGQNWGLAMPSPRYRPEVVPGIDELGRPTEMVKLVARTGYPMTIHRLIDQLRSACCAESNLEGEIRRFDALMALCLALLRRAHDLTLIDAVSLLDLDDEGLSRLVDTVLKVVDNVPSDPFAGSISSSNGGSRDRQS